ncbi:proteasome assembly chaperone family protein [Thermogladius sp. 4427co]|uniref:proteasome assembly chaperone family protein n=1 Tax=Thermogladius sp. 4427co TaxID=3450718 RepID=UPI003F792862
MSSIREEVIKSFRFREYDRLELKKPSILVFSVPDTGLVSTISMYHLVRELELKEVGDVEAPALHHIAIVQEGYPRPPIRIFAGGNILAVSTDFALPLEVQVELASAVIDYSRIRNYDYVIGLTGIPSPNRIDLEELKTFYVASVKELADLAEKSGANPLRQGVIIGPYATLLRESVKKGVNTLILLTESFLEFPDPEAAARGLQVFSKIIGREIDVKKLLEEAEMIKLKTRELMRQTRSVMEQMKKVTEYQPSLYV